MEEISPKSVPDKIDIDRRKTTLSDEVAGMLITQIGNEIHNHNAYRTFQNYYTLKGYDKIAEYYRMRALEELEHHIWILTYLNNCDVPFSYPKVKPIEYEINDDVDPFRITVDLEIETTVGISSIVKAAWNEGDYQTFQWLMESLIKEQHEEESTSRTALDIAESDASWVTKGKYIKRLLTHKEEGINEYEED